MVIRKLIKCPRCNGDLLIERESDGWYENCPLCGYRRDISDLITINTVGQIKILDEIEVGLKSGEDVVSQNS
jgi:DNA-directed RNA polymerase subunit M/transcription elongation factor TFIIS